MNINIEIEDAAIELIANKQVKTAIDAAVNKVVSDFIWAERQRIEAKVARILEDRKLRERIIQSIVQQEIESQISDFINSQFGENE